MCRLACRNNASKACDYIPERLLDEPLRWLICLNTYNQQVCERFRPDSHDFYERVLRENAHSLFSWVPKQYRTPPLCLLACQQSGQNLWLVPQQYRSPEVCLAACRNYGPALQWVPQQHRTAEICQAACKRSGQALQLVSEGELTLQWFVDATFDYECCARQLLIHARRLLCETDFQALLERSVLCSNNCKLTMLTLEQVSGSQKKELIEWILAPHNWPAPVPPKASELCDLANPLEFTVENPELKHLAGAAVQMAPHWTPPRYNDGRRLQDEIEQVISSSVVELPGGSEPLFCQRGDAAGGRTLKIEQGEQAYYYKFQRKGESLKTLIQEGAVHTVRERHPALFGQLNSQLPGATRFFRLYFDQLPAEPAFPDPLEICTDENGRSYVHVYRYVAATEYSVYAHRVDSTCPSNPWFKGERGILTACHDIGQFVALGLVPTSTLPAFHDSQRGRAWIALHALLGYEKRTVHPGTFGAWNSVATEYCDFGYGGFRDVGDFEPFGAIESVMQKSDVHKNRQVPEVEHCLCLVNAICENLIAAHLIRARLRQSGRDYHYKNPEALQQTKTFIEQSLLSFLQGLYGDRIQSDSDRSFLLARLELDEPAYERWLARTAVEILYWTAKQPDPGRPDLPPFPDSDLTFSHRDGYALHLNRTGQLDPELYPNGWVREGKAPLPVYPEQFQNSAERLNLGCNNSVFPLTTLMRGLVRLCTGILTYDQRRRSRL